MKCETPAWLNIDFVEMVLKNSEHDRGISVKRLTIEPIEEDNYGSMIFRIIVEYSREKKEATKVETKSLIIKTASTVECLLKNLIEKSKAFETEIKMMETTLCRMNEILKESSDDNCRLNKLLKLSKVCWDKLVECSKPIKDEFNVLNHGDCATRNKLFRYDANDKIVEQIFIDFQTSVWCSPAMDILYFFNSSFDENVDVHHRESLLCEYLDTLTSTMKRIGCRTESPCMRKLKESLDRCAIFEIITTCVTAPLMTLCDKKQATAYDDLMLQTTMSRQVSPIKKGLACQKEIMRKLSEWETRGLIDALLKFDEQ